ncbi:MAG: amino acid adenylation domain protein [Mucilaginibacter sp.]|nr:amino acid adenylation domain protein [Mucilaginibacter sp.]
MINKGTIADIFSKQAKLVPENVALRFGDLSVTYKQLDERSNQLARYLIARGVVQETLVPICINRSIEMIIGILGVIKAGGAYVPIDPQYPKERIAYILEDTKSKFVISNNKSAKNVNGDIITLDGDWESIGKEPVTDPVVGIEPSNLLFIIYTSGSTGKPKGVMIEHQSLAAYIDVQSDYLKINDKERILQFSNYCFDASVEQIFLALLNGSCLVLLAEDVLADMDKFSAFLKDNAITHLHATPGFLENLSTGDYPGLKRIISAGDLCKKELFIKWLSKVDFYNKYGPTEATISVLEYLCPADGIENVKTLPIGKALPSNSVYILNDELKPVEDNTTGEIYIGGIQVARGYFNQLLLTEKNFLKSPFKDGERIYKTGDLAKQLPDGNIAFLGRIDDQVKIRGYRIELAEVENTLRSAPAVKQCVVVANDDNNGKRLVAYIVADGVFNKQNITTYLLSQLPEYMVPQLFVELNSLPLTANGKIDKKALPAPDASEQLANIYVAPRHETEKKIAAVWKSLLNVKRVGVEDDFFELGGNSLLAQKLIALLKEHGLALPVAKLYQYATIGGIAAFLDGRTNKALPARKHKIPAANHDQDIAVIGMAGRFPGANTILEFWENIKNGIETTHFFTDEELDSTIPDAIKNNPNYVKARGIIDNPAAFDPAFFGINTKLAELMDPQQRVFLEIAWEALESSGHVPQKYNGTIGVYAGCRFNTYYTHNVISNKELIENVGVFQVGTVSDKDYLATRTAYSLDLKGPAVNVQSACSTSLLAIAQAVESIRNGQCDVALAGGSSMLVPVNSGHLYEEGAMLSSDGHCHAFDADAEGTVFSDGAGVVVLKSKEQAERDGDTIYALIKGVGLSNDGGGKSSFTAPSAEGQAQAIMMAIDDALVDPADISYIETHGTATPLGDPIEIEGLKIAFGDQEKNQYCAIGSVKSNFGHLTAASGVVGLIKTSLALYHKQLPPSINYKKPNPHIDFENSPFFVNTTLNSWDTDKKRIAGVSSFGVGGTNVHIILSESETAPAQTSESRPAQLLCWSAKAEKSLNDYGNKLIDYLGNTEDVDLADVAYTLHASREDFNHRRFVIASGKKELLEKTADVSQFNLNTKNLKERSQDIVFMFPGQGDQFVNMGKYLYDTEKVFRLAMDECAEILKAELYENILDTIYPAEINEVAEAKLKNTAYSQPALFTIGYALGKLWMSWGIFPAAFVGHSIGEFVSAYFAGVYSLTDALKLIATRGKLMGDLPGGSMLSVRLPVEEIKPFLSAEIALAAVNSPKLCVVAGTDEAITKLSDTLNEKGVLNRLLSTSHAFHSHMMDAVVSPFEAIVKNIKLNEPLIPIVSSVTGEWLKIEEAISPGYWARHLRSTVVFGKAIQKLVDDSYNLFLELGPGNSVSTLTRQQADKPVTVISSFDKGETNQTVLKALGQLWLNGIEPNWTAFYKGETRRKLTDVPTYAFNNKDYWVYPVATSMPILSPVINTEPIIFSQELNNPLPIMRKQILIDQVKEILENASGIEMSGAAPEMTFIELGFDSLLLTQVALILKKQFSLPITFRQLNEEYGTLDLLTNYLDANLPADAISAPAQQFQQPAFQNTAPAYSQPIMNGGGANQTALDLISQQLQLLAMQVALAQGQQPQQQQPIKATVNHTIPAPQPVKAKEPAVKPASDLSPEEEIEIKKPFGAAARIEKQSAALTETQSKYLASLTERYNNKTKGSKEYTQKHRAHMADPRVVSGFKPATKELVYSVVINKSKGSRVWDIDGNEYIDALNGFGSNMLGYQPDFIKNALIDQIDKGYEIGPQHELAGEVSELICEFTKFDRAGLCNTGSEAVLGAMRIARTVTGRSTIVAFTGSYHGIMDEVIVRGSKKLKTFPAAPGILPEAVQNMLILDYGTEESLRIIEERAHDIAAVLVEPVQSRRADFQPIDFLKKLRKITTEAETVLIFDEVISGFRFHPAGVQGLFGIKADIGTYGKVAGGGISIGIIAGKKKYMDALDGGFWQFGDDSIPEVGVTYFAGTFVRHPLALATAKASLNYLKEMGPQLQENLNANGLYIANTINAICKKLRVPLYIAQFGSLWRIKFIEEYPYTELFFTLMRLKGIHVLEGFACFLTTAHTNADIQQIVKCFEESLIELKEVGFIPDYEHPTSEADNNILNAPPVPNAKLGKDKEGNPAWFIIDEKNPGKYLQVN